MWDDRQSRRMETQAELLLYHQGVPAGSGKASDVSMDGLFVRTGPLDINRDDFVEVEYRTPSGTKSYRFPAVVVRKEEDGIGLYVEREDKRAAEGIRALMGLFKRPHH